MKFSCLFDLESCQLLRRLAIETSPSKKQEEREWKGLTLSPSLSSLPQDPSSVLTWNANGLAPRPKTLSNLSDFCSLVKDTKYPDIVSVQEVRLRKGGAGGEIFAEE